MAVCINSIANILNGFNFTIPSWVPYFGGSKLGFNLPTVTAPQIPYLAQGAVITQPTLAMMGEYAGASSNPEIVAPQSLIAETVASVIKDVMGSTASGDKQIDLLRQQNDLLQRILEKDMSVNMDGVKVGEMVTRCQRNISRARGY